MSKFSAPKIEKSNDLYLALKKNRENLLKFQKTDEYKKWTSGEDVDDLKF